MNNIERIFEAVCNILSVYVSFKVTDVFLEKKRKLPRMANIVYVIVWLINTVVAFGFRNAMGTTVSMVCFSGRQKVYCMKEVYYRN